jgi:hypothetical protein
MAMPPQSGVETTGYLVSGRELFNRRFIRVNLRPNVFVS